MTSCGPQNTLSQMQPLTKPAGSHVPFFSLITMILCIVSVTGNTAIYSNHLHSFPYSRSANHYGRRTARRSRFDTSSPDYAVAAMVARNKKSTLIEENPPRQSPPSAPPEVSFDDLGPVGKAIAGATQIVVTTLLEYCSGFFAGMVLGTAVGLPGFVFRPLEPGVPKMFLTEVRGRFGRMNSRSVLWARSWGGISAAFGGFKVAVTVVRNGKQDDWNQILSSAAAGAFFARSEGPRAMLKGALFYGCLIYFLSGGMSKNRPLAQYTDEAVEF